jgi:hypothetical protein
MRAAANYAFCNRQLLATLVREVFERFFGTPGSEGLDMLRSTTWRTTSPSSSRTRRRPATPPLRPPQGRHPRFPGRPPRGARRPTAGGPAGDRPRRHGPRLAGCWSAARQAMERSFGTTCHGAGRALEPHGRGEGRQGPRRARRARRARRRRPRQQPPRPRRGAARRLQGRRSGGRRRPPGRPVDCAWRGCGRWGSSRAEGGVGGVMHGCRSMDRATTSARRGRR